MTKGAASVDRAALDRELSSMVEELTTPDGPGVVAHIEAPAVDLVFCGAAGQARSDTGEAMTVEHAFHTASIGKTTTAFLLVQLAAEGALGPRGLDSCYVEWGVFPDEVHEQLLVREGRSVFSEITLRQMLTHTSGMRDVTVDDGTQTSSELGRAAPGSLAGSEETRHFLTRWRPWLQGEATAEERGVVDLYLARPGMNEALFEAGTAFHYSDTAFVLLALLLERVTGSTFHEVLQQRLVEPLGMGSTYQAYRNDPALGPKRHPESDMYVGTVPLLSAGRDLSFDWGGGGLVTSAADLVRFQQFLASGKSPWARAMTTWVQPRGLAEPRTGVGLGLFRTRTEGGELWGHSGAWGAKMFWDPEAQIYFAGTVNRSGAPADWHHGLVERVREAIA